MYMYKEYDVNGYTFWLQIINKGFDSSIFLIKKSSNNRYLISILCVGGRVRVKQIRVKLKEILGFYL